MSDQERIAALEARLAALEGRLAVVEARGTVVVSAPSAQPTYPLGQGVCQYCRLPFSQCRGHNICITGPTDRLVA